MGPAGVALTALAMAAFAANSLLCRAALASGAADALGFTALRLGSGAVVLLAIARWRGTRRPGRHALAAAGALLSYALLFSLAYTRIPAGVGALALFGAVQVTMIGAGIARGEHPSRPQWVGLAIATVGLVGLTAPGAGRPDLLGTLLMVGAGVGWGVYSLEGRRRGEPVGANAESFVLAGTIAIGLQLVTWPIAAPRLTSTGALLAVASGAVASAIGYVVWYAALARLTAMQAAVVQLSVPPLAALAGVALLGERFSVRLGLCTLAILGGIGLVLSARRPA